MPSPTSQYPAQLDTTATYPMVTSQTPLGPDYFNNSVRQAIINMEITLGVNPAAGFGTIGNAIITLQSLINNSTIPSGPAGGDLGGDYPNPFVVGMQGTPISGVAPTLDQVLQFNGSVWAPSSVSSAPSGTAGGDLGGTYPNPKVVNIQGIPVSATTPTINQILGYNGSDWAPTALPSTLPPSGTASGDLSGSYPNPTVAKLQGTGVSSTPPSIGQTLSYNGSAWAPSNISSGTPTFVTNLTSLSPSSSRQIVFVDGYSSQNDGGQGYFNWNSISTLTANIGTIIQVTGIATGRWERIYDQNVFPEWFGARGDGFADDTAAIQAAINAVPTGGTIYFSKPIYAISQLIIDCATVNNITLEGNGAAVLPNANQTIFVSNLTAISGTTGTFSSVVNTYNVVMTGLTGVNSSTVALGDWITVSNAVSTETNGKVLGNGTFPIVAVGNGTVTFFGWNAVIGASHSYPPVVPDTNNGSLHWTIGKPMMGLYSFGCTFKNLCFHGGNQAAVGVSYTNSSANVATINNFINCTFINSTIGVVLAGVNYATVSSFPVVNNSDQGKFHNCFFGNPWTGIIIPSLSFQQKQYHFTYCVFQNPSQYGIISYSGQYTLEGCFFSTLGVCGVVAQSPIEPISIINCRGENTPKLFVGGNGVKGPAEGLTARINITDTSFDNAQAFWSADGYIIEYPYTNGLKVTNFNHSLGVELTPTPTIALNSPSPYNPENVQGIGMVACILENVNLCSNQQQGNAIVTNTAAYPVAWSQTGCGTEVSVGANYGQRWGLPDGVQWAFGSNSALNYDSLPIPQYSLANLCVPPCITTIINGNNTNLNHGNLSQLEVTGGGTSAVLQGLIAGYPDQLLTITNLTGHAITITNEDSGESTAVNRFHVVSGSNVVFNTSVTLRYSDSLSRWLVQYADTPTGGGSPTGAAGGNLSGTYPNPVVASIQSVPVSTNSVANDGYALVSTSGTYVPKGARTVLNVKNFGAKGDGSTDDTVAINNALAYVRSQGNATVGYSTAPSLFFPEGNYIVSNTLLLDQCRGAYIYGASMYGTSITGVGSGLINKPVFKLQNSQYCRIENFQFFVSTSGTTLTASTTPGTTTITVGSTTNFSIGQDFMLADNNTQFREKLTVSSIVDSTHLVVNYPGVLGTYTTLLGGQYGGVFLTARAAIQVWSDFTDTPLLFDSSNNRFENITMAYMPYSLYGIEIGCHGGPAYGQTPGSDLNNENHRFYNVSMQGAGYAGVNISGQNANGIHFTNCDISGFHGITCYLGNFNLSGGSVNANINGWTEVGGWNSQEYVTAPYDFVCIGNGPLSSYSDVPASAGATQITLAAPGDPLVPGMNICLLNNLGQSENVVVTGIVSPSVINVTAMTHNYTTLITSTHYIQMLQPNFQHPIHATNYLTESGAGLIWTKNAQYLSVVMTGIDKTGLGQGAAPTAWSTPGLPVSLDGYNCFLLLNGCLLNAVVQDPIGLSAIDRSNSGIENQSRIEVTGGICSVNTFVASHADIIIRDACLQITNDNLLHENVSNNGNIYMYNPTSYVGYAGFIGLTSYLVGQMRGVTGISDVGSLYPAKNLGGTFTLTSGSASIAISFPGGRVELDGLYHIIATPVSSTGGPATGSNRTLSISKSTGGFTFTAEAAPGGSATVTYDWFLFRA